MSRPPLSTSLKHSGVYHCPDPYISLCIFSAYREEFRKEARDEHSYMQSNPQVSPAEPRICLQEDKKAVYQVPGVQLLCGVQVHCWDSKASSASFQTVGGKSNAAQKRPRQQVSGLTAPQAESARGKRRWHITILATARLSTSWEISLEVSS